MTGEDLSVDDLIELKASRIVRPRPPTLTSIPSLLSVFQNEWDALALETFTLRQNLTQTRQELSSALYENDAARRVIARLSRERDEARDALAKIGLNGPVPSNGDGSMQIDSQELPPALIAKVEETQEKYANNPLHIPKLRLTFYTRLSKTRRKRAVPSDWVTAESIETFKPAQISKPTSAGARSVVVDNSGDLALFGGEDGQVCIYSTSDGKVTENFAVRASVTSALWAGNVAVVATAAGTVEGYQGGTKAFSFSSHSGEVTALALHPCGDILASVGIDKCYIFYDLANSTQILRLSTATGKNETPLSEKSTHVASALTSAQFHPDGHLFAAGGMDGQIKVFDVKSGANAANFDETGPIQALDFSENGTWLAAATKGSSSVSIWDLRKSAQIKSIDTGGPATGVCWDYTGQFLASAGSSGITVQQYSKSSKEWSEPLRSALPSVGIAWGNKAQELVALSQEGVVTVFEADS